jgi:hypothetical protein
MTRNCSVVRKQKLGKEEKGMNEGGVFRSRQAQMSTPIAAKRTTTPSPARTLARIAIGSSVDACLDRLDRKTALGQVRSTTWHRYI